MYWSIGRFIVRLINWLIDWMAVSWWPYLPRHDLCGIQLDFPQDYLAVNQLRIPCWKNSRKSRANRCRIFCGGKSSFRIGAYAMCDVVTIFLKNVLPNRLEKLPSNEMCRVTFFWHLTEIWTKYWTYTPAESPSTSTRAVDHQGRPCIWGIWFPFCSQSEGDISGVSSSVIFQSFFSAGSFRISSTCRWWFSWLTMRNFCGKIWPLSSQTRSRTTMPRTLSPWDSTRKRPSYSVIWILWRMSSFPLR